MIPGGLPIPTPPQGVLCIINVVAPLLSGIHVTGIVYTRSQRGAALIIDGSRPDEYSFSIL